MARDRLAALRAQQGGQYDNISEPSYPAQSTPERYQSPPSGGRRGNPFAQPQQQSERYEMEERNPPVSANANGAGYGDDDMSGFYSEITSIQEDIKTFNSHVQQISELHSRSLNNVDDEISKRNASQLEALVEDTSALGAVLKRRVKALERQVGSGREAQIKKNQIGLVKSKFVEAIQSYQEVERQYRAKYKQRVERQFRIVKPDATPEEVKAVTEDDGAQIFSQALMSSNRYGESRAAYREVQERHADIKRIEKTLTELAQLFNDMSVMVEQQDEAIDVIEGHAEIAEKDLETGLQHTEKAVNSARAARKKRWICFFICLIILAIIGIVVGVVVSNNLKPKH
ncbi:t-SNARE [Cantharellus anzutake]|uniref:t-SNARE n=1 Tax=Cantharellus anzutake TaxID=1750568 RepID=UPI001904C734|nr:t-SNARE [Cantharellus anzutake]KAF8334147.1 t-SNARE [Cantharellus anzutake]